MEQSLSGVLVSPKSIQGGQTSPIMWLYNSKVDSYWIGTVDGSDGPNSGPGLFGGKLFWKELSEDTDPSAPREKLISSNKRKYIWSRELLWSLSLRRNILIFAAALNISWAHHLIRWDKISQQISVPMKEGIIFFADNTIHWFKENHLIWSCSHVSFQARILFTTPFSIPSTNRKSPQHHPINHFKVNGANDKRGLDDGIFHQSSCFTSMTLQLIIGLSPVPRHHSPHISFSSNIGTHSHSDLSDFWHEQTNNY